MKRRKPTESALDPRLVEAIRSPDGLARFFACVPVQDEQTGDITYLRPATTQRPIISALALHQRVVVNKPRQCYASTVCLIEALRRSEYWPGHTAAVITHVGTATRALFNRLLHGYERQDRAIRVPAETQGQAGVRFGHGGGVSVYTAAGKNQGVGSSLDFLHASEFGSWPNAQGTMSSLLPALNKRPHSRIVIESTPGRHGSTYHGFWLDTLAGKTGFHPVFIKWWEHASYEMDASDIIPTDEERELQRLYAGMTRGHIAFRRFVLNGPTCNGDERLFARQYPYDEMSGWSADGVPALPAEPLNALLPQTGADIYDPLHPLPGHEYLIACDPAGYGSSGDPSAWTLWDRNDAVEVGTWSGRIEPVALANRLAVLGRRFNNAQVVIESNAAACISSLMSIGYPAVYHTSATHPGWYRTSQAKDRAHGRLVRALNAGRFNVRSKAGLLQLMAYDGTKPRGQGHHWDRVDAYLMAADILVSAPREPLVQADAVRGRMTVAQYKALHPDPKRGPSL